MMMMPFYVHFFVLFVGDKCKSIFNKKTNLQKKFVIICNSVKYILYLSR